MTKKINVSVEVGYDLRTITLTEKQWQSVKSGKKLIKSVKDYYEGEPFTYRFCFNENLETDENSSLVVTYDDLGVGFTGKIEDALVNEIDN